MCPSGRPCSQPLAGPVGVRGRSLNASVCPQRWTSPKKGSVPSEQSRPTLPGRPRSQQKVTRVTALPLSSAAPPASYQGRDRIHNRGERQATREKSVTAELKHPIPTPGFPAR